MEGEINAVLRVKNGKKPFGKEKIEIFLVFLTVTEGASRKASNGSDMIIFSFFFMLFYSITHAIISTVTFIVRGIFKVLGFILGVGH